MKSHNFSEENISASQKQYIKKIKRKNFFIIFARIFLLLSFIILWEVGANLGIINDFIFSSPKRIIKTFIFLCVNKDLYIHFFVTLSETVISFFIVLILGILIAIILWFSDTLAKICEPFLIVLNSLPKSALAPVLIVWLGNNMKTIIFTAILIAVFATIINIYTNFTSIEEDKIKLIKMLGGNKFHILTKLLLPNSIPTIISTAKVNIGLCLVGVIIGEFLAAKCGLGYLIIYGSQVFKMDWVLTSICLLCIMAMGLYKILNIVEKIFVVHL